MQKKHEQIIQKKVMVIEIKFIVIHGIPTFCDFRIRDPRFFVIQFQALIFPPFHDFLAEQIQNRGNF